MAEQLGKTRLTFGKYKGKTFDEVPLRYLDKLLGQTGLSSRTRDAITKYLSDPVIARELEEELNNE